MAQKKVILELLIMCSDDCLISFLYQFYVSCNLNLFSPCYVLLSIVIFYSERSILIVEQLRTHWYSQRCHFTFTLSPFICHPGSRSVNSILMFSLLLDTNRPERVVSSLFPFSASFSQTTCYQRKAIN